MSLEAPRYKLYAALKSLRVCWDQTRQRWRDPVRQRFEEEFWNVLDPAVTSALGAVDRLSQVLQQARRECD